MSLLSLPLINFFMKQEKYYNYKLTILAHKKGSSQDRFNDMVKRLDLGITFVGDPIVSTFTTSTKWDDERIANLKKLCEGEGGLHVFSITLEELSN